MLMAVYSGATDVKLKKSLIKHPCAVVVAFALQKLESGKVVRCKYGFLIYQESSCQYHSTMVYGEYLISMTKHVFRKRAS